MKHLLFLLIFGMSALMFSQEKSEDSEEFVPVIIGEKEAFMSTMTGEYVFRSHKETNPEQLQTTNSGVIYKNNSHHKVKANESLFAIAKKYNLTVSELMKTNKLSNDNLRIGQKLLILKKQLIKSSSPVISYDGEERIVARLKPNQSPWELNSPHPDSNLPDNSIEIKESNIHVVKGGETLFSIAKKNKLSVQKLKEMNNLVINDLSVGQKLKLK